MIHQIWCPRKGRQRVGKNIPTQAPNNTITGTDEFFILRLYYSSGGKSTYIIRHHCAQHTVMLNKSLLIEWINTFPPLNVEFGKLSFPVTYPFLFRMYSISPQCQNIQAKRTKKSAGNVDCFSQAAATKV